MVAAFMPLSRAYADTTLRGGISTAPNTGDLGGIAPKACTPATQDLYAEVDFNEYTETKVDGIFFNWEHSGYAMVPDNGCVKSATVKRHIVDSTAEPNCQPVVDQDWHNTSPSSSVAVGDRYYFIAGGGDVLSVLYFGHESNATTGIAALGQASRPPCARTTSTITLTQEAFYENNLGQNVRFDCRTITQKVEATPAGPIYSTPRVNTGC
jgi:hypothetical protein